MASPTKKEERDHQGLGVLVMLIAFLPSVYIKARVAATLYGWFLLPVFPSLPHLTAAQFAGFGVVASFVHYTPSKDDDDAWDGAVFVIKAGIFFPLLTLLFAWILNSVWVSA